MPLHMLKNTGELHCALLRFCVRDVGPATSGPGLSFVFARDLSKAQGREVRNEHNRCRWDIVQHRPPQ